MIPRSWALGVGFPLLILAVWALATGTGATPAHVLPPPSEVVRYIAQGLGGGELVSHILLTIFRVFAGFGLGYTVGVSLGVLTSLVPLAGETLDPTLHALRAIPPLAWIPLFLLWFGIGEESKVLFIALASFFPVYLNVCAAVRSVDRKYVELGRILGLPPARMISQIYLPASAPGLWTGARSGLGLAWMVVVASEFLGASRGLGFLLQFGRNVARPEISLACLVLFALLGKVSDTLLAELESRALRWRDTHHAQAPH